MLKEFLDLHQTAVSAADYRLIVEIKLICY